MGLYCGFPFQSSYEAAHCYSKLMGGDLKHADLAYYATKMSSEKKWDMKPSLPDSQLVTYLGDRLTGFCECIRFHYKM